MTKREMVCLCEIYPIKSCFSAAFEAEAGIALRNPDEIADPLSVTEALAFSPAPDAFARFPNLRIVCSVGAGVDGLLAHPDLPPDLPVVRMINPEQAVMMAGFAANYVVAWHRRLWEYPAQQEARRWDRLDTTSPSSFPVAVLGFGGMGRATARALGALGYPVTGWAGRARDEDGVRVLSGRSALPEVLGGARAVVNVLPLTDATRGLLNAETFALMRPDSILIQIGRGRHLVEPDLIAALDAGCPAAALLDVTEVEPLPRESPLWAHPRVRITPHIASENSAEAIARSVRAALQRFDAGEAPAGLVDRARGY